MLGSGKRDGEIKLTLSRKWGIARRTVEDYLAIARQQIRREIVQDKRTLQGNAIAFYRSILSDKKLPPLSRLRAQENIDRILGLHSPVRIAGELSVPAAPTSSAVPDINARQDLLKNPQFVEWARQQAMLEDREKDNAGRLGTDTPDADSGPVREDGDEGDA